MPRHSANLTEYDVSPSLRASRVVPTQSRTPTTRMHKHTFQLRRREIQRTKLAGNRSEIWTRRFGVVFPRAARRDRTPGVGVVYINIGVARTRARRDRLRRLCLWAGLVDRASGRDGLTTDLRCSRGDLEGPAR